MDTLRDARRMQDEYEHSKGRCNLNCIVCREENEKGEDDEDEEVECCKCENAGEHPENDLIDGSYKCPDCGQKPPRP